MKQTWEQTAEDMDVRFSGGFQAAGGNSQSLTFMLAAAQSLPVAFGKLIKFTWDENTKLIEGMRATIADYGCALGDGTALLQAIFPLSTVIGYDISPKAVELARERWPHITFEVGNILQPKNHGIVFASHVIEHMQYPHEVVQGLIDVHQITVVIVPVIGDIQYKAHQGAMPTAEWLAKLPTPYASVSYNTIRADLESDNELICEGNHMFTWRNEDYHSDNS